MHGLLTADGVDAQVSRQCELHFKIKVPLWCEPLEVNRDSSANVAEPVPFVKLDFFFRRACVVILNIFVLKFDSLFLRFLTK